MSRKDASAEGSLQSLSGSFPWRNYPGRLSLSGMFWCFFPLLAGIAALGLGACAAQPAAAPAAPAAAPAGSILQSSNPAPGATVQGPLNSLVLHFQPPARLDELLVAGPDGTMPMMISAAGEQAHYTIPLPALGPGVYNVSWRATSAGQQQRGNFAFTVK